MTAGGWGTFSFGFVPEGWILDLVLYFTMDFIDPGSVVFLSIGFHFLFCLIFCQGAWFATLGLERAYRLMSSALRSRPCLTIR